MRLGSLKAVVLTTFIVSSAMGAHATTVTQLSSASQLNAQDKAFAITPPAGTVSAGNSQTLSSGTETITFSRASGQFEVDQAGYNYGNTAFSNNTKLVGAGGFQGSGDGGPVSLMFSVPVTEFGLNIEDFDSSGTPFTVAFTAYDPLGVLLGNYFASGVGGSTLSFEGLNVMGDTISRISFSDTAAAGGSNNLMFGNIAYNTNPTVATTPEPTSMVLLGSGMLSVLAVGRRRLFGR